MSQVLVLKAGWPATSTASTATEERLRLMRPGFAKEEHPGAAQCLCLRLMVFVSHTGSMCTVDSVYARQKGEQ